MAQLNGETVPVAQEKINTDIVTLTRFLTEEQSKHKEATGDFTYAFLCQYNSLDGSTHPKTDSQLFTACYATRFNSPLSQSPTTFAELPLSISVG